MTSNVDEDCVYDESPLIECDASHSSTVSVSKHVAVLSIASSFIAMISSGAEFMYAQYSFDLRTALQCNQEIEEIFASMLMLFSCMGPINGALIYYLRQQMNCLIATSCLCIGYFYVFFAILYPAMRSSIAVSFCFGLIGFGTGLIFAVGLDNIVHSVSPHHCGRAVAMLSATASSSGIIFSYVYAIGFQGSSVRLAQFFMVLSVVMVLSGVPASFCLKRTRSNVDMNENCFRSRSSSESTAKTVTQALQVSARDSFFWLVAALLFLQSGISSMHLLNVGTMLATLVKSNESRERLSHQAIILGAIGASVGRISIALSDFVNIRRGFFALIYMLIAFVSALLLLMWPSHVNLVYLATIGFGSSYGVSWALYPVLVREHFPVEDFSQTWAFLSLAPGLGSTAFNLLAGYLYELSANGQSNCVGTACYHSTYFFASVLSAFGVLVLFWLIPLTNSPHYRRASNQQTAFTNIDLNSSYSSVDDNIIFAQR